LGPAAVGQAYDMMKKFAEYDIQFAGLSAGVHHYDYELNALFFKEYGDEEFDSARIYVGLDFEKSDQVLTLNFKMKGVIHTKCDRCLDKVSVEVDDSNVLIVRFDSEINPEDAVDDVIVISRAGNSLNIAQHIYDFVNLALPMRVVHEAGACNPEIDKIIKQKSVVTDSRWDKLKSIVKENN